MNKQLEIGGTLKIDAYQFGEAKPEASFEFTEHATDHWGSDNETAIDIDEAKAREIIEFLEDIFKLR